MALTTDQQTLEDLNIFGRHGSDSIYGLFNRTLTRGGAALLEECFRYPLADAGQINGRSRIIREMASAGVEFPWKPEIFDQAEQYLAITDERTKLRTDMRSVAGRVAGLIAEGSEDKVIHKGVAALVEILKGLREFAGGGWDNAGGAGWDNAGGSGWDNSAGGARGSFEIGSDVDALLGEPGLQPVLEVSHKGKLPFETIAAYDVLLRFRHRDIVHRLLRHVYRLDMYISVAKVARQRGFAFAEALPREQYTLRLEGCYHPQVKNAVVNSLGITPESNLIFLTGANMAGKSTFMKSLGIALFLAHIGLPVPAASMRFSVRDAIYTTINLPDNLGIGASHFYAEVLRVKKIARELGQGKSLFVIFDELFRGTNVKDAYEATVALASAFAGRRESTFVISTHIIEAGDVLRERCPGISFRYLPTRLVEGKPVYTYTLDEGITSDRHGMVIITNEGILEILQNGKPKITNI